MKNSNKNIKKKIKEAETFLEKLKLLSKDFEFRKEFKKIKGEEKAPEKGFSSYSWYISEAGKYLARIHEEFDRPLTYKKVLNITKNLEKANELLEYAGLVAEFGDYPKKQEIYEKIINQGLKGIEKASGLGSKVKPEHYKNIIPVLEKLIETTKRAFQEKQKNKSK